MSKSPTFLRRILLALFIIAFSMVIVFSLKRWVIEGYEVPTTSMMPTFRPGDRVWVNKLSYLNKDPARGDMVVFPQPGTGTLYVKRIIGLPGDRITVLGRMVYLAGAPLETISTQPDNEEPLLWGPEWEDGVNLSWATMNDTGVKYRLLHPHPGLSTWRQSGTWKVPQGHVFVLGDSRDDSSDSRSWGPVSFNVIVGKVMCRVDSGKRSSFSIPARTSCHPDAPIAD